MGRASCHTSGFIEAVLLDWGASDDDSGLVGRVHVPAAKAYELGFIDAA